MKRTFLTLTALASLGLAMIAPVTAHAQTASEQQSQQNTIWSGLWQGANLDLSSLGNTGTATESAADIAAQAEPQSGPASKRKIYAALGDSIAAGAGLPGKATPRGNDTRCDRSKQAYGFAVAKSAKLPIVHAACSGATAGDLVTKQSVEGPNIASQLNQAYAAGTPQLITISAGANDVKWADFIQACYYADNCARDSSSAAAASLRAILQGKLEYAINSIYNRSGGSPPTVILTGYYNPFSPACAELQPRITATEIAWLTQQTAALNQTIREVADNHSFVKYAPVHFMGHDICSKSPWVQGLADPAPFHPTAAGQKAIARSVINTLNR
jgi:lysophospholipase L1-like esterase